jgi:hypothetical protein
MFFFITISSGTSCSFTWGFFTTAGATGCLLDPALSGKMNQKQINDSAT